MSPIGMFDSGAGGLNVLFACRRMLARESFLYLSDHRFAPYGSRSTEFVIGRALSCTKRLCDAGAKAVVVACNTATNAAIEELRSAFIIPIIGVEPALKPASKAQCLKQIVLLCTPVTAASEKFSALFKKIDGTRIQIAPQKDLASLIEQNLHNLEAVRPSINQMLSHYPQADAFVLGCTHYAFVADFIRDFYAQTQNRTVQIFDGARGTANHLANILKTKNLLAPKHATPSTKLLFS